MGNSDSELQSYFGDFDENTADKEAAAAERGAEGKYLKLPEGKTVLRFLPPKPGQSSIFQVVMKHHFTPIGRQESVQFACPSHHAKGSDGSAAPCPLCTQVRKLEASSRQADNDRAREMFPRKTVYANVVRRPRRDEDEYTPRVQIYGFSGGIHKELLNIRATEGQGINFSHPITGRDVTIIRKGQKLETKYKVFPDVSASQLAPSTEAMKALLESAHDLRKEGVVLSLDDIMDLLENGKRDRDDRRGGNQRSRGDLPRGGRTAADDAADDGFGPGQ